MPNQPIFNEANHYISTAPETTSLVTGSSPLAIGGHLVGLICTNTSGSNAYIQVFDGYATPAGGSTPLMTLAVGAGAQQSLDSNCFHFQHCFQGIVVVLSSTLSTYTAVTSNLHTQAWWF